MADAVENLKRLQRNVRKMLDMGAPDEDVQGYLSAEGYSPEQFKAANARMKELGGAKPAEVGFGGRALNSAMFGLGDEAAGVLRASGSSSLPGYAGLPGKLLDAVFYDGKPAVPGNYAREVAGARMGLDEYQRQYPGRAFAADITGAVAPAIATGGAIAATRGGAAAVNAARTSTAVREAPTLLGTVGSGIKYGALEGAVSGFGEGEGTKGSLVGAAAGGALGAGLGGTFGGMTHGARKWAEKINPEAATTDARRYFHNLMGREGESLAGASDEIGRREALGVRDNIVPDVMGPGFRSEASAVGSASPQYRREYTQLLEDRARGQAGEARRVLSEASGGQVGNTAREAANRLTSARAQAGPLYDAFRARQPFVDDPQLTDLLTQRPALSEALTQTQRSLLNRGVVDPSGVKSADSFLFNPKTLAMEPTQEMRSTLTPTAIDRMVKVTGRSAEASRNPMLDPALRNTASDTMAARGALLDRVDQLAPEYAQARSIFAGAKEYGDKARAGRQFLDADSETAEELLRQGREGSAAGQEAFREGTLDSLGQRLDRSENVAGRINQAVPRVADSQSMNRMLDAFPNMRGAPYGRLVQQLDALAQQSSVRNQNQGFITRGGIGAPMARDQAAEMTSGELSSISQGNTLPMLTGMLTRALRGGQKEADNATRAASGPFFTAKGSKEINPFFDEIARQRATDLASDRFGRFVPGMAGGAGASVALTSNPQNQTSAAGISSNRSVGPDREMVQAELARIDRDLASDQVPAEEKAYFRQKQARLRAYIGQ